MKPISCIFHYAKRVVQGGKFVMTKDGKSWKTNDNYISFLQVISAYWETIDDDTDKKQLNVFLNGGSVLKDRNTGDVQMKSGYTLQLPEFLGVRFMEEWYNWSCQFGLAVPQYAAPTETPRRQTRERSEPRGHRQVVREEEFVDESAVAMETEETGGAAFE